MKQHDAHQAAVRVFVRPVNAEDYPAGLANSIHIACKTGEADWYTSMSKSPADSANRGKLRQIVPANGSQMVVRISGSVECRGDIYTFF